MATATPNILINSIRGKIGNVVFYTNRGTQCVRAHVIPRNPDTEAQRLVRRSFGDAVRSWQSMTPDERYSYNRKARYLNMSGYNLYISKYLKRIMQSLNLAIADEQKSIVPYFTRNLELSTLNSLPVPELVEGPLPERFPSVSKSYLKASGINTLPETLKHSPG